MALKRLAIDGYGQIELNQVAFRRDGRIEAQCALSEDDFTDVPAENGMLLAVDNINRVVKFPVQEADGKEEALDYPVALNYTTEHMYDERLPGLKNYKTEIDSFYPRLGYLAVGDKFTTNCLCADDGEFEDVEAVKTAYEGDTPLYGGISKLGAIKVSATKPTDGPVLLAVKGTGAGSMPDGQFAIKFQVIKA